MSRYMDIIFFRCMKRSILTILTFSSFSALSLFQHMNLRIKIEPVTIGADATDYARFLSGPEPRHTVLAVMGSVFV